MAAYIQVVLREPVKNLGKSGELVRVRPGYARNYLVPRSLAVYATEKNVARLEHEKREATARAAKLHAEAESVGKKLAGVVVQIAVKTGADDRLYGAVTSKDIAEALARAGHTVDRRKINLPKPLHSLGSHEVSAHLAHEVTATFRVEVVRAS